MGYCHPSLGEGEKQLAGGHTGSTPPMESLETQPYNSQPYNLPRDPTLQQPPKPLETKLYKLCNMTINPGISSKSILHVQTFTHLCKSNKTDLWKLYNFTILQPQANQVSDNQKPKHEITFTDDFY